MDFQFPVGATPISDTSGLLLPWVHNMMDLNRVEAENISYAQRKYLHGSIPEVSSWFHWKELCLIHCAMFGKVWNWAGKQRKSVTSIGVEPHLISLRMAELCKEVAAWSIEPVELTFVEKGARVHHCLVQIHPFENGNGRFSRLVADRCLLSWKCSHPIWPENLHWDGETRQEYIQSLQSADKGDYAPLVGLMKHWGATDPELRSLLQDHFYRSYREGSKILVLMRAMLRSGLNPNSHHALHQILKSPLAAPIKLAALKLWVDSGAEVNQADRRGMTPFQVAVDVGDKSCAVFLKSKGAQPLAPPGAGYAKYYNMFLELANNK